MSHHLGPLIGGPAEGDLPGVDSFRLGPEWGEKGGDKRPESVEFLVPNLVADLLGELDRGGQLPEAAQGCVRLGPFCFCIGSLEGGGDRLGPLETSNPARLNHPLRLGGGRPDRLPQVVVCVDTLRPKFVE